MTASLVGYFRASLGAGERSFSPTVIGTEGSTYRKPGAQMLLGR